MSWYATELHKWLNGDFRTDGVQSDWLKEQLRRRAEEMGQRNFVAAPQIKVRQERKPSVITNPSRICEFDGCEEKIRRDNKTGRCIHHCLPRPKATPRPVVLCPYTGCGKKLRISNQHGVCSFHFATFRRLIHQDPLAMCNECGKRIRRETKFGLCRKHAMPLHSRQGNVLKKTRRAELKKAA